MLYGKQLPKRKKVFMWFSIIQNLQKKNQLLHSDNLNDFRNINNERFEYILSCDEKHVHYN